MNDYGYVYLVGFNWFEHCYKIGSTQDPIARIRQLECQYGPTDIIVCGDCENKQQIERKIQWALYRKSNAFLMRTRTFDPEHFLGPARSREHFVLDHTCILDAYSLINENCDGLFDKDYRPIRISSHKFGETP